MSLADVYQLLLRGIEGTADPHTLHFISREGLCLRTLVFGWVESGQLRGEQLQ